MKDFKIEGKDRSRHRIIYNVRPIDYREENKKYIIDSFCKEYGVDKSLVEVVVKYIDSNKVETSCIDPKKIDSIQKPEFQYKLIEKYFQENDMLDLDMKRIREIDSRVNSKVDFDKYEKKGTYKINWISFDNFLSYGDDNFIDFRNFNGLVLLRGNPANQSGKTTLCNDLVHFILFGRTKSGKADSMSQLFNKFRPEKNEVKVSASITVLGEEYIIERLLTRPEKSKSKNPAIKNSVQYYRVHEGNVKEELEDVENLKGESTTSTNAKLKEAIGNEADFDLMSCINASNLNEIIYLKDSERSRAMIRWFGLQSIEDKSVIARDIWNKEISKNRYCNVYNRERLNIDKNSNLEEISRKKKEIESKEEDEVKYTKAVNGFKKKCDNLLMDCKSIKPGLDKIDYHTLETEVKRLYSEHEIEEKKLSEKNGILDGIPEVIVDENRFESLMLESQQLTKKIAEGEYTIKQNKDIINNLETSQYCPVCKRKYDNVNNSEHIAEYVSKNEEITKELNELKSRNKEISDEISKFKDLRAQKDKRNQIVLEKAAIEVNVSDLKSKYSEKLQLLKDIKDNEEAIRHNNGITNEVNTLKVRIDNGEKYINKVKNEISQLKIEIASKEAKNQEIDGICKTIENELEEEKCWKAYNEAIGKDGITKMILRESIPLLNSQINNMLEESDIDFNVEIRMNEKNEILFLLKKGSIEAPLSSGSGYEQLVSSLVLRTVISQFSMISKPPFIILDEILGSVSSENLPKVRKLFENISTLYDFVFHITHLEEVVDWHNRVITVKKVNNVSSIK